MIIGLGNDLANIERIKKSLEKFGSRFVSHIFSAEEKEELRKREKISPHEYACSVARRFSAKEACSKALGTGFKQGTFWSDIIVTHNPYGKPQISLRGGAQKHLERLAQGHSYKINVSMTDDYPWAQAIVIIETID